MKALTSVCRASITRAKSGGVLWSLRLLFCHSFCRSFVLFVSSGTTTHERVNGRWHWTRKAWARGDPLKVTGPDPHVDLGSVFHFPWQWQMDILDTIYCHTPGGDIAAALGEIGHFVRWSSPHRDNATALAEFVLCKCSCLCMWYRAYRHVGLL